MTEWSARRSFLAGATAATIHGLARAATPDVPRRRAVLPAAASGTFLLGGELPVRRIGLGTAEFTGPGRWGPPADPRAIRVLLRRAVELGVNLIDTADVYGPGAAETIIYQALFPYPRELVITTKGGQTHDVQGSPNAFDARPQHLRAACEASLRRLRLEQIPLYYLHSPDPQVPYEDSLGELVRLQQEGKIRHIGVGNVDLALLHKARSMARLAAVQNAYNVLARGSDEMVALCEQQHWAFIPYGPLAMRGPNAIKPGESRVAALQAIADARGVTLAQVVLAWQLARSPVLLPIPGTTRVDHLEQNVAAAGVHLTAAEMRQIG